MEVKELFELIDEIIKNGKECGLKGLCDAYETNDHVLYLFEDFDVWNMEVEEEFEIERGACHSKYFILDKNIDIDSLRL